MTKTIVRGWIDVGDEGLMTRSGSRAKQKECLQLAYLPERTAACGMRSALRAYLNEQGVDAPAASDLVLAAEEAFINAILHAGDEAVILVSALVDKRQATVEVRDLGHGFDAGSRRDRGRPRRDRAHGRGLFLIHQVMDEVQITSGRGGTTVQMVRRIA